MVNNNFILYTFQVGDVFDGFHGYPYKLEDARDTEGGGGLLVRLEYQLKYKWLWQ